jgi:nicotinate-nucleotide adenylyltransferase
LSKHARKRGCAIAIFGGTFDPIHRGHLIVAAAAARRFRLDKVFFVPSSRPPHKAPEELAAFPHRYAMVALACAGKAGFMPSLAEAPDCAGTPRVFYSIDTVRRFRNEFAKDHIYFILGADSFLDIPIWKSYEDLLDSCDFIIVSRPGIRIEALGRVIPSEMLNHAPSGDGNSMALRKSTVYLLTSVASDVSSTDIRQRCARGASIHALVPPGVEDYIQRQALYR